MKKLLPSIRPIILMAIGLIMAVISAGIGPNPVGYAQNGANPALQITSTPTPTTGISEIGSTDGIVLMGIIIVLIVLLPVLLRRRPTKK